MEIISLRIILGHYFYPRIFWGFILHSAGAEMAHYHGLPSASWALSDSVMLDSQASYEKLFAALIHTLSKVNIVWGIGNIGTSKSVSPEVAVIDNEIIGNCLRFSDRFKVDDEHLAFDLIKDVAFNVHFLRQVILSNVFRKR